MRPRSRPALRPSLRPTLPTLALLGAALCTLGSPGAESARAAEPPPGPVIAAIPANPLSAYARAEAPPAETTLFLFNKILLTTTGFERKGATYETDYSAKVSPFKSLSENGRLTIEVTDDQLRRLERGEAVDFTGRAVSKGGDRHAITGTATPTDKTSGKLKVHIEASIVTLRFETTYRFTPPATSAPPPVSATPEATPAAPSAAESAPPLPTAPPVPTAPPGPPAH